MKDYPIIPFNLVKGNKHLPDPRSIIQIALSDYRKSELSDKELAEHICNSLGLLIKEQNLTIEPYNNTPYLTFKEH